MDTERLKPCPFCGGGAHMFQVCGDGDYVVGCDAEGCWTTQGAYATEAEAVAAWNRRATPTQEPGE